MATRAHDDRADTDAPLRVRLLGRFEISSGGAAAGPLPLPAGKATTVAELLAVRRGSFVAVDTIAEALWGEEPPPGAAQNVASLVSRLRRVVGADAITGGRAGYRFEPAGVDVDVDAAERLIGEAESELRSGRPALAASAATQARALLERGELLEEHPFVPWADEARRDAARLLRQARRAAWNAALALGDHAAALAAASKATEANPLDEGAHRARMRALARAGDTAGALAAYEAARAALADELGADPSPQTEALYLAILRAEPLPREGEGDGGGDGAAPPPRAGDPSETLAGREDEVAELARHWSEAAAGRAAAVLVTGVTGSGKTRVCAELADHARATGAAVLWATCHEAERSLFLQPVLEGLRTFLGAVPPDRVRELTTAAAGTLGELMPDLRGVLAPGDYERATPEIEHRRALEGIATVLRNTARHQPVLVVLDDVHHAGESTREAVSFLLDRLSREPILVLLTAPSDGAAAVLASLGHDATVLTLHPLTPAAIERVAHRLGVDGVAAGDLHARTGGNAQFVVEALRLAAGGADSDHPESLHVAVLERVRRAGPDVEDFLRVAAVAGATFDLDFVANLAALPEEDAGERAERALWAGLLTTAGPRFEFAGSVIRDALYETTPAPIRVSRHRRAAAALADRPEAAAVHHGAAGDWADAHRAWSAAAEQAIRAFAIRDAERVLAEAVAAAVRAGDRPATARARMRRGQMREELADYGGAQADHTAALAIARELGDEGLEAQALERLGWTAYYGRDAGTASELAAQATELAESAAAAPAALPSALVLLGRIRHWAGDIDGSASAYESALARSPDPATTASALSCLGALLEHGDRFVEARRTLDRAAAQAARTGAFRPLLRTLFFAGLARANLGDLAGALRALERKRRLLEEYEVPFYRARTDTLLSWIWREVGDRGRASDLAEQAVQEAREVQAGTLQVEQELHGLLGVAECALLAGDETTADALVAEARPLLDGWLPFRWRADLRWREVRCRLAPEEAEDLLHLARERRSRKYEALALAHLGRRAEAATVAASTGSDLLVAEVGPIAAARPAFDRLAAALPADLRGPFVEGGRLAVLLASRGD